MTTTAVKVPAITPDESTAQPVAPSTPRPATRRRSLDVARGVMLVAMVAVNAWFTMPKMYEHAPWEGVNLVDVIFPTFVVLSGCGLGFAYFRRVPLRPSARRFVVLLICGLAFNAIVQILVTHTLDFATLRYTGVLQVYAGIVALLALLRLVLRRWWSWLIFLAVLSAAHVTMVHLAAQGCPETTLTPTCNPLFTPDLSLFGAAHVYAEGQAGHDPEGLFSLVGIMLTAGVGFAVATALSTRPVGASPARQFWQPIGHAALVVGVAGALAWTTGHFEVPMKRLWTAPFALGTAAVVMAALVVLAVLLDHGYLRRSLDVITYPLVALGRNSLLVYFGTQLIMVALLVSRPRGSKASWARTLADDLSGPGGSILPFVLASVMVWAVLAMLLHSRRIYFRP